MENRIPTRIVRGQRAVDGAGVQLQRVLGLSTIQEFDPFLMLDGFDSTNPDDYTHGFPWHPHRGIETVTYLIQGEIEHADSLGNKGVITDLSCQWMTAGSGIIHQEMPKASPRMLGCQLWVNLPASHKMTDPAYNDITHKDVPLVEEDKAAVRVLSGAYRGTRGPMQSKYVDVLYLDIELKPGHTWNFSDIPKSHTLFIYLIDGTLAADPDLEKFEPKACAILFSASDEDVNKKETVLVKAGEAGARFLLLSAKPLKEPVAWGGPIVMNTREELDLAFDELEKRTFIKHPIQR